MPNLFQMPNPSFLCVDSKVKDRTTRLQTLANFFQNLGTNRRGSRSPDATPRPPSQHNETSPGPVVAAPSRQTPQNGDSRANSTCCFSRLTQLPPISSANARNRVKSVDTSTSLSSTKLLDSPSRQIAEVRPTSRGRQHERKLGATDDGEKTVRSTSIWISKIGVADDTFVLRTHEEFK